MTPKSLESRAKYISLCFKKFPHITKAAKAEWIARGNTFAITKDERLAETVYYLLYSEIQQAVVEYLCRHPEEIEALESLPKRRRNLKKIFGLPKDQMLSFDEIEKLEKEIDQKN